MKPYLYFKCTGRIVAVACVIAVAACGDDTGTTTPTGTLDSGAPDGTVADGSSPDSGTADSAASDSRAADSTTGDTGTADAATSDAREADGETGTAADAETVDGTASDAGEADSTTGDSGTTDAAAGDAEIGDGSVTLADEIFPILTAHCAGCHGILADGGSGSGLAFGHLDLSTAVEAYANLVGDAGGVLARGSACGPLGEDAGLKRVVPDNSGASLLYNKVETNAGDGGALTLVDGGTILCGHPMPTGPALSATQLALIQAWINQGRIRNRP